MKTWIIILSIVFIILKLVKNFLANYIRNDKMERIKYQYTDGASPLGMAHGIISSLSSLILSADVILLIIFLLDKI